ncbi:MAG: glycerate kinase [Bacteroidetes bacterium]|nr:glycerate kinase [Bacteroidota bacterium]
MTSRPHILIAIDSFKGSISSYDAASAIERGLKKIDSNVKVEKVPLADGGEGTVEAIISYAKGSYVTATVHDPLMRNVSAVYGLFNNNETAVLEMAAASGIGLLSEDERDPAIATTYGTGELILDALNKNCGSIIIGIGGSATNDGGVGMAMALGAKLLDYDGQDIGYEPQNFSKLYSIDFSQIDPRIKNMKITVLCDVNNPLVGKNGASHVYGSQKGADKKMIELLDANLKHLADVTEMELGRSFRNIAGAGAAGGLGFGLVAFLGARLQSGINFLTEFVNLEKKIRESDIVITGEGKVDSQTMFNKLPVGIAELAKKHNKKTICIAGQFEKEAFRMHGEQFDEMYFIMEEVVNNEDAMSNAAEHLERIASEKLKHLLRN